MPHDVPGSATSRAARTPQSTGLNRAAICIQPRHLRARDHRRREEEQRQADEVRDRDHRRLAAREQRDRLRDARRTRCSRGSRRAMITSQPSTPGVDAHAERERDEQDHDRLDRRRRAPSARSARARSRSATRASRGSARSTLWSRSLIIDMPLHVAPKNAFITTIAGARNVMYDVVPKPPSRVTFLNSCP